MSQKRPPEEKNKILTKSKTAAEGPSADSNPNKKDGTFSQLQRTAGNAAVQRLVAQRASSGEAELDEDTTQSIQNSRGGGQPIDERVAARSEDVIGADFSDVRVHTDAKADQLSRKLNARAFTTGNDIFFREGEYAPNTQTGEKLLAHELTHVAQQGGNTNTAVQPQRVNDPAEPAEVEADKNADLVTSQTPESVQRAAEEEEVAQLQEDEEDIAQLKEDDEEIQTKLQRQEFEDEVKEE